jgi:hypothetical protein
MRLAIFDLPISLLNEVSPRLRGATLHAGDDAALNQCDAIVCNASSLDATQIDALRQNDKRLFLVVDQLTDALIAGPFFTDPAIQLINPERYHPKHQLIRQQLDAGRLGEPGLLRLHRWEAAPLRLRDLDLVHWYFGKAPNLVYATANPSCTQIHLGFPGGGMALLDYATRLPNGDTYYSMSLIGAHGAVYADDHVSMQLAYQGGSPRAIRSSDAIAQWTTMLQAFATGSESYSTWHDVLAVNDAIEQSLRTKQSVFVKGA